MDQLWLDSLSILFPAVGLLWAYSVAEPACNISSTVC
jgi:hypothetical protein